MKRAVIAYAEERDETEAIIVREALAEYFAKRHTDKLTTRGGNHDQFDRD